MIRRHFNKARHKLRWYADSDRGLAILLALLVLYVFILYPLFGGDTMRGGPVSVAFSLLLVAGVVATASHQAVRAGVVTLAVVSLASHWLHVMVGGVFDHMISSATALAFFCILAWFLARRVFAEGDIGAHRILGAVAVYLLLGLIWAEIYLIQYLAMPGAFAFAPGAQAYEPPVAEMAYFSFVTLTTVGFGDITALHPFTRSMVMMEALVGQLYPAIVLARLVTEYQGRKKTSA